MKRDIQIEFSVRLFSPSNMVVSHSEILLSKCALFREQGEFIDIRLKVCDDEFPAHRIVLAANSDYFHAMFAHGMKESNQDVIELKDENISAAAVKIIMDTIYSGEISINDENVFEVLVAADHLQVTSVIQQCCDFLQTKFVQRKSDVSTYCRISMIADRHGLSELLETSKCKMASMYKDICENEEFLSLINADQLLSLLSRDDLNAPTENFVFKSVMQWIRYKKEERMGVAAKVIGAVRLGLVDIRNVITELNAEEMKQLPEIKNLLLQSLLYSYSPSSSTFSEEKAKLRSSSTALVAVLPKAQMQCFDMESKSWKLLEAHAPATKVTGWYCAEVVGSKLFVADYKVFHSYDIERNVWKEEETYSLSSSTCRYLCTVGDYIYAISLENYVPQRYCLSEDQWQQYAGKTGFKSYYNKYSGATVHRSKVYVLYGRRSGPLNGNWVMHSASLCSFDPVSNEWEENKSSTCQPHFESSLLVVNDKMYVAGGYSFVDNDNKSDGKQAPVEVYDEEKNTWSIVEQKRIPRNNRNVVEIEGRVYFIINKFPFDSGIRIPPEQVYPVCLDAWKDLANIPNNAVLCHLPMKKGI
ncbi:kelch-like protein 12 [Montipora foliosa]|uniref:kelch-like protein 12 n=1 Tax=Montipora foliosa TaxID=591990 RepID=UPI0035F199C4